MATEEESIDALSIVIIGVNGSLLTFLAILGAQVLFYRFEKAAELDASIGLGVPELQQVVAEQRSTLHNYKWVDKKEGILKVPIERAMQVVVRNLADKEATPSQ